MKHIIRIGPDALRIPLLCLWFPLYVAIYILCAAMPVCMGGHPNKGRLLALDFYGMPIALFWAAWDGDFVPTEKP